MSNKGMIIRECEHLNSARRVLEGRIDCDMFFRSICGDLLITGMEAGNKEMVRHWSGRAWKKGMFQPLSSRVIRNWQR